MKNQFHRSYILILYKNIFQKEKIVASCSKYLVIVADYTKNSEYLTFNYKKIPIEVTPMAYIPIKLKIEKLFGGELNLRMAVAKAGPCVTDNGNFLLDWHYEGTPKTNFEEINKAIQMIPGESWVDAYFIIKILLIQCLTTFPILLTMLSGVVDTGLFIGMAKKAYFGMSDGSVVEIEV